MQRRLADSPHQCPACMSTTCKVWDGDKGAPRCDVRILPGHQRAFKELGFEFDGGQLATMPNY